jgi:hypothetical protein
LLLACACVFVPLEVDAQASVSVAVFPSANSGPSADRIAGALDKVVVASLGQRRDLAVATRPALDLFATALALGCGAESVECLSTIAREADVQALIAPSVEAEGTATIIRLTYFDARAGQAARSVVRRYEGDGTERSAIDAVPDMVNELLGSPRAPVPGIPAPRPVADPHATAPAHHGAILAPIALASLGVVATGVGIAFGISAKANESKYRDAETGTIGAVDRAHRYLDRAHDQARAANIAFAVGAAGVVAGAVWLAFDLSSPVDRTEMAISTQVGPDQIGLALNGSLGGRSW